MGIKFDIDDVKNNLNTIEIIDCFYVNANSSLQYKCECSQIHKSCYANLSAGKRHKNCEFKKQNKKITKYNNVKNHLLSEGYELLSLDFKCKDSKLLCKCPKDHIIHIRYGLFSRGVRCSKCFKNKNKGKNHPSYNKNLSNKHRMGRRIVPGYLDWCKKVKQKNNYTCQICFCNKGGNLVSHHVYGYNKFPQYRTEIWNGRTLCKICHNEFHGMFGNGDNDFEQFSLFIQYKHSLLKNKIG